MTTKERARPSFAGHPGFADFWAAYRDVEPEVHAATLELVAEQTDFAPIVAALDDETLEADRRASKAVLEAAMERDEWPAWIERLRGQGETYAAMGVAFETWDRVTRPFQQIVTAELVRRHGDAPARLVEALMAQNEYVGFAMTVIAGAYFAAKEARFSKLVNAGLIGMVISDVHGGIHEANDAFLDMVGYTRDDLRAGRLDWQVLTPPDWQPAVDRALGELATRGACRPFEKEYFRKDGRRIPVLAGVSMLSEGECVAFVLDLTDRKQAERLREQTEGLQRESERARETSRLKGEFLANMSHELRTPLHAIIGFTELMHDGKLGPVSAPHKEYLGDILTSARHLQTLINDVLDLSKIEAGKMRFRPIPVELETVVAEVADILRGQAQSRGIELRVEVDSTIGVVELDPAKLKQVLYNYVSNALKFTAPDGHVCIRAAAHGDDDLLLEVIDDGQGISADDLNRLFTEFEQLDPGRGKRAGGTGLGLALTRRIVTAQGGRVGVRSQVGHGSVFFAVLPRVHSGEVARLDPELGPLLVPGLEAPRLLVVEDDPADRRWLQRVLLQAGYAVQTATNLGEARALLAEERFDGVTLDLLLGQDSGLTLLAEMRQAAEHADTPVVVVTVAPTEGLAFAYPVDDVVQKPCPRTRLVAALERAGLVGARRPVLVVDDAPTDRAMIRHALEEAGLEVIEAGDGREALARLDEQRPAAIILDLAMPTVDGFEFLEHLRARRDDPDIPVLVWTHRELDDGEVQLLSASAQAVLAKDARPGARLVAALEAQLANGGRRG